MNKYKGIMIPIALANKYHGSGYAMCSVNDGQLIDLIYVRDVILDIKDVDESPISDFFDDDRLRIAGRWLQASGDVLLGRCSAWRFVEL